MKNDLSTQNYIMLKIIFIGDSGVGKSSLIYRQTQMKFMGDIYPHTIGCDFQMKFYDFNGFNIKGQLWDTAGAERFRAVTKAYYRNANIINVCFDLNNYKSFQNAQKWVKQASQHINKSQIFLIGCKNDLKHQVDKQSIQKFCQIHGLVYFQTSAKQGNGVSQFFNATIAIVVPKKIQQMIKNGQNPLQKKRKPQSGYTCW